jgi:ADP-ribose pyrophosphatase YjhB (NUDIX family)
VTPALLPIRKVARVIVLNDFGEILLINHVDKTPADPKTPDILSYWVPPGGGVEIGETFENAAIRELVEETGVVLNSVGKCILIRDAQLMYAGQLVAQQDRFFFARISGRPSLGQFGPSEGIVAAKWWPIAEIENSTEAFFPSGIPTLLNFELKELHNV